MALYKITFGKTILHDAQNLGHLHVTVFVRKLTIYNLHILDRLHYCVFNSKYIV